MLDPFTVLGLAGDICQFIDLGYSLARKSAELYESGQDAFPAHTELNLIVTNLTRICDGLESTQFGTTKLNPSELALHKLAASCNGEARALLAILSDVTLPDQHKKWKSFQQAFRHAWEDKEIREIMKRLGSLQNQLNLHLVTILKCVLAAATTTAKGIKLTESRTAINSLVHYQQFGSSLEIFVNMTLTAATTSKLLGKSSKTL
jgi:hypothetical protein